LRNGNRIDGAAAMVYRIQDKCQIPLGRIKIPIPQIHFTRDLVTGDSTETIGHLNRNHRKGILAQTHDDENGARWV
jgi:hypothetical protein